MNLLELPLIERPVPYLLPMGFTEKPALPPDPNWRAFLAEALADGWPLVTQGPEL